MAVEGGGFHTGDGGAIDDEGHLVIVDRRKDMIIPGGEQVSSIEVEQVWPIEVKDPLHDHPAVGAVAVNGVPDERWGETVRAGSCPAWARRHAGGPVSRGLPGGGSGP